MAQNFLIKGHTKNQRKWTKAEPLPSKLIITDENNIKHDCQYHRVAYDWYGGITGVEYYEWNMIYDRKVPVLSVRGENEEDAIRKMKDLIMQYIESGQAEVKHF